jgi:hypothetical protein
MTKKKSSESKVKSEIEDLGAILSGEMDLREKRERILKEKKKAVEEQKRKIRDGLKDGNLKIKDLQKNKKIVQKIKLFEWEAPIRVPFEFEKKNFLVVVAICLAFILYLAVLGHYLLMFAIISFLFLIYAAGTTKPVDVKHSITARGIETMDVLYEWHVMGDFFFTEKKGQYLLIVETSLRIPSRLIILVKEKDIPIVFLLLQDQLLYKDVKKQNKLEVLSLGEYIPLEKI